MKEFNLGRILLQNRHKRGITQDELAAHIGVSKGAVSKWETGASLPDITLLPQLASYFDISIDELIGYEPQIEKADIQRLYRRLTKDFSTQPFEKVLTQCYDIAKKYYSCYPLLFQLGVLLVNHSMLASDPELAAEIIETALKWFCRVSSESDEPNLQKQALQMEAYCLLTLNRPSEVLDLLDADEIENGSPEPLLASAHQMLGNHREAKKVLQAGIYKEILSLFNLLPAYMNLCLDDPEHFEETCLRFQQIADTFQMRALHPGSVLGAYLTIAQNQMAMGNTAQALDALSQYTDLAVSNIYPLHLHGDDFFDLLDDWLSNTLTPGNYPPRDDTVVRRSMTQALTENPSFIPLAENERFQSMITKLKMNEEEQ